MPQVVRARSARNALARLDVLRADAILDALSELARKPETGHQLHGHLTGLRTFPVGSYRIIHELNDSNAVRMTAIRHRGQTADTDPH